MTLGGYDQTLHKEDIKWVKNLNSNGWYAVTLEDISVDGISIGFTGSDFIKGGGTIVDSGTTDTYLPR